MTGAAYPASLPRLARCMLSVAIVLPGVADQMRGDKPLTVADEMRIAFFGTLLVCAANYLMAVHYSVYPGKAINNGS